MSSAPQKSTSVTAVKGHLVNKSSPLATDSCKLEKQFITAQNMASHYKRVINAKPTIDTAAPKSLTKSIKAQDRAKKEIMRYSWANKNSDRAKSAETPRSITEDKTESKTFTTVSKMNSEIKPRVLPDQQKLNKSMSNMMINFTKHNPNRVSTYRPKETGDEPRSHFVNPMTSSHNLENQEAAKKVMSSIFFNSSNEHNTSGILNPALKAMSRLVAGHNYDVIDIHAHKFKQPTQEFQPRIKNVENSASKLKESTCYEPPRRHKKVHISEQNKLNQSQNVPKEEHKTIKLNKSKVESSDDEDFDFKPLDNSRDRLNNSNVLNISSSSARKLTSSQISLKRTAEKEEQLKYLEFIKDVTDDILQRNLTTDRVIRNCFNYHLKKNKHRLNEKKMLELLDTLREDIGIAKEDEAEIGSNYYQTVNKAILLDKEKNKENNDEAGTEYLTLRKFGYTSLNTSRSLANNGQEVKVDLNTSQVSQTRLIFDDYESQIKKNIQTIRRKSTDSSENEKVASRKNSLESHKSLSQSPKQGSILKKSRSQSSEMSAQSSELKSRESLIKQESQESKPEIKKFEAEEDDDDDGDIFVSSKHSSKSQSLNNSRKNSLVKQSFSREDFEDEGALFNNDYGEPDKSVNSEDDDNFDELIKTQAFKKNQFRRKSTESNSSDLNEKSPTPTPRPRISKSFSNENKANKNEEMSDEDDF